MEQIIGILPQVSALIEKGGIVGLLLLAVAVLVYEVRRLRKELGTQFVLRDKYRLGFALCKQACDLNNIKVDLSPVADLLKESGEPA